MGRREHGIEVDERGFVWSRRLIGAGPRPPFSANVSWTRRADRVRPDVRFYKKEKRKFENSGRAVGARFYFACINPVLAADVEIEVRARSTAKAEPECEFECRSVPTQEMPLSLAFATIEARSADLH